MTNLAPEQDPAVWNLVADTYASYVDRMTGAYAADVVRLAALRPGERVLDLACGAGAVTIPAARTGADVLAVDIAPAFTDIVRRRAADGGVTNIEARVMDGQALDLPDGGFDAAVSNFGVFLFPERAKGFRELHRVLKPGGRAVVTAFRGPPENEWMAFFGDAVRTAFPELPPPTPPKFLELADPDRLRGELDEAGFSRIKIETVRRSGTWANAADAWSALAEGAPLFRPLLERIGPEGARSFRQTFENLAEERYGQGPITMGAPAHCAVAWKA